jgi:hypothetical protein
MAELQAEIAAIRSCYTSEVLDEPAADKASAAITEATRKIESIKLEIQSLDAALPEVIKACDSAVHSQALGIVNKVMQELYAEVEAAERALWEAAADPIYKVLTAWGKLRAVTRVRSPGGPHSYPGGQHSLGRQVQRRINLAARDGEPLPGAPRSIFGA